MGLFVKSQLSFTFHFTCTVFVLFNLLLDKSDIFPFVGDWNGIVVETKPFVFVAAPLTFGFVISVPMCVHLPTCFHLDDTSPLTSSYLHEYTYVCVYIYTTRSSLLI